MDQLDELMESDILEALGEDVTDTLESEKEFTEQKDETSAVNEEIILEDMNDVISRLSKSTITKTSPGKRIWKEFDQTQQRLAHTWKQPTPGPQYYGTPFEGSYNQRILSHAKSKPSFNFAPKRHVLPAKYRDAIKK